MGAGSRRGKGKRKDKAAAGSPDAGLEAAAGAEEAHPSSHAAAAAAV